MLFRLVIILFVLLSTTAYAVEYTYEQKLRRGEITEQKFTTCRLAAKKTFGKTKFCIYKGANGTYEQHSVPSYEMCQPSFECEYIPRKAGKESIKTIMEKLERQQYK